MDESGSFQPGPDNPVELSDRDENPYAAPVFGKGPAEQDAYDEMTNTRASGVVKAAGALQAVAGLLVALSGIQLKLAGLWGPDWVMMVPYVMMGTGALAMVFAVKTFKTRGWAAIGGTICCGAVTLGMGVWVLVSLASGLISLIATVTPMAALAGSVVSGLAIAPCLRADAARRKIAADGIDLSF